MEFGDVCPEPECERIPLGDIVQFSVRFQPPAASGHGESRVFQDWIADHGRNPGTVAEQYDISLPGMFSGPLSPRLSNLKKNIYFFTEIGILNLDSRIMQTADRLGESFNTSQ